MLLVLAPMLVAQSADEPNLAGEDELFFEDPFATESDDAESRDDQLSEFDSLFSDDAMIDTADEPEAIESPQDDLLTQEAVIWGGTIRGSVTSDWSWDDYTSAGFSLTDPTSSSLNPVVGADLFFSARPQSDFRAYGKLKIDTTTDGQFAGIALTPDTLGDGVLPDGWTAEEDEDGNVVIRDQNGVRVTTIAADAAAPAGIPGAGNSDTGNAPGLEVTVFELFSDYTWNESLFFRFGKHTIRWGTGYFFSPADVLNLTAVDAEDPTADREGPISLRTVYPFGVTGSAYLYAITNANAEPLDIAIAPKVEFVLGPGELGLGGYYQRSLAPRLVGLYTASAGDVDFFGEAVLLWGSDRVFVAMSDDQSAAEADPEDGHELVLDTYREDDRWFAQATIGARYLKQWENGGSLIVVGQYFFNGEGYEDSVPGLLPAAARLALNPGENGLALDPAEQPDDYVPPPTLGLTDLANWGRHYFGGTIAVSDLPVDDLSLSALALVNLSDLSAILVPAINYRFLDRFSMSLAARFTLGESDDEFTDPAAMLLGGEAEPTVGLTLTVSMPGASF